MTHWKGGETYVILVQLGFCIYTSTDWIVQESPKVKLGLRTIGNMVTLQRACTKFPKQRAPVSCTFYCRSRSSSVREASSSSTSYSSHIVFPRCPEMSFMMYSLGLVSARINLNCTVKTAGRPLLRAFVKWAVGLLPPLEPYSVLWSRVASGLSASQSFFHSRLKAYADHS